MASSVYSPRYITAAELHALLQAPDSRAKTLVVDVRDDDREGGHVAGSINVPSQTFGASVTDIEQAAQGKDLVVFHCMFSQQRGPACAAHMAGAVRRRAAEHAAAASASGDAAPPAFPPIVILERGFSGWAKFVSSLDKAERAQGPPLVEKYDRDAHGYDC